MCPHRLSLSIFLCEAASVFRSSLLYASDLPANPLGCWLIWPGPRLRSRVGAGNGWGYGHCLRYWTPLSHSPYFNSGLFVLYSAVNRYLSWQESQKHEQGFSSPSLEILGNRNMLNPWHSRCTVSSIVARLQPLVTVCLLYTSDAADE